MPRTYIAIKRKGSSKWSDEQLQAAIAAVEAKVISAAAASRRYGIPASTLHGHFSGETIWRARAITYCHGREGN